MQTGWICVTGDEDNFRDYRYLQDNGKLTVGWYSTYPPVYVPELHDKYEGTLVEKELQRNYDCLREAKKRGVVMTIGSDSLWHLLHRGDVRVRGQDRLHPGRDHHLRHLERCQDVPHRGRDRFPRGR